MRARSISGALSNSGCGSPHKREDARGTWLESHFGWQIRTFWWGLLWLVVGAATWIILIGWLVWGVACVWFVYRIAKGWLNLNDNKPMPVQ